VSRAAVEAADRSAPASVGRVAARLLATTILILPVALAGVAFGVAAAARRNLFAPISGSSRLALADIQAIEGAIAASALYLVVFVVLAWITRPRRVRPDPATMELGDDPIPPAVAGFLVNAWLVPREAVQGTLLDLGARGLLAFREAQPGHTVVQVAQPAGAAALTAYERRVLDHVTELASNGTVPGEALATWPRHDSTSWFLGFDREVTADARGRGLSRARWPSWSRLLLSLAAAFTGALAALAIALAPRLSSRSGDDNGSLALAVGLGIWIVLSGLHLLIRSERDTLPGRSAAAHWLGVRRQLHGDEVFPTLPPAAIAIWNRYLAYGAALGAAGEAVRQLPLGAEDPRHAWSSYGGRWRMVTVRYPRLRPGWGQSPWRLIRHGLLLAVLAAIPLLVLGFASRIRAPGDASASVIPSNLQWVTPLIVVYTIAVGCAALFYLLFGALDAAGRRTVTGQVLRVQRTGGGQQQVVFWIAVDDGTRPSVNAWRVDPQIAQGVAEGATVTALTTSHCAHVMRMTVQ
jgi:Predicted membrane protein (DUF2207)